MAAGVFLAMLSSLGWGLAGEEGMAAEHRRGRCHRATSATPYCGASRRQSSPWDAGGKLRFRGL
jgi:hypothetical protein